MTSGTVPSLSGVVRSSGHNQAALDAPVKIAVDRLNFYYGEKRALDGISIKIRSNDRDVFGPNGLQCLVPKKGGK